MAKDKQPTPPAVEPKIVRVKFLRDYTVNAENGETHKAGQTVSLPEPSANHFIVRGVAELAGADKVEKVEKPEPPAAE